MCSRPRGRDGRPSQAPSTLLPRTRCPSTTADGSLAGTREKGGIYEPAHGATGSKRGGGQRRGGRCESWASNQGNAPQRGRRRHHRGMTHIAHGCRHLDRRASTARGGRRPSAGSKSSLARPDLVNTGCKMRDELARTEVIYRVARSSAGETPPSPQISESTSVKKGSELPPSAQKISFNPAAPSSWASSVSSSGSEAAGAHSELGRGTASQCSRRWSAETASARNFSGEQRVFSRESSKVAVRVGSMGRLLALRLSRSFRAMEWNSCPRQEPLDLSEGVGDGRVTRRDALRRHHAQRLS